MLTLSAEGAIAAPCSIVTFPSRWREVFQMVILYDGKEQSNPHDHLATPNPTGGTAKRGDATPFQIIINP